MQADAERLIAEIYLELKAVKSELKDLRRQISGNPGFAEGWADAGTAWQALRAEGVKSQKHLQKLRLSGAFSEVKREIRNISQGDCPT